MLPFSFQFFSRSLLLLSSTQRGADVLFLTFQKYVLITSKICTCVALFSPVQQMGIILLVASLFIRGGSLSSCQDDPRYSSLCSHYKTAGLCQTFPSFLSVLCPLSCHYCPRCDCQVELCIDLQAWSNSASPPG